MTTLFGQPYPAPPDLPTCADDPPDEAPRQLTPRLCEILDLLVAGRTPKEIRRQLGVTDHTLRNYLTDMRACLGARTTAQAAALWVALKPSDGATGSDETEQSS